jgi:hypothetical protein
MRQLATIVLGLAFFACASPEDVGKRKEEGTQAAPATGAAKRDDMETRTGRERAPVETSTTETRTTTATGTSPATTTAQTFSPPMDPSRPNAQPAQSFVATVQGTKANPKVNGTVSFRGTSQGVAVSADIQGLTAGNTYTYAVTTYGDCSNPERESFGQPLDLTKLGWTTATPPTTSPTGAPGTPPPPTGGATGTTGATGAPGATAGTTTAATAMPGALGQLELSGANGRGSTTLANLSSEKVGLLAARSVVIYMTPAAGSKAAKTATGGRQAVACGVIGIAGEAMPATPTSIAPQNR